MSDNSVLHMLYQLVGSTPLSAASSCEGNIKAGSAGKINNLGGKKKKKGWLPCRGWTPQRQEQTGRISTKVNSILDNTSQLSTLWGAGKLKTPLRCYTECFRLFFVSQPLHCSMLHVQMALVLVYWEGIDRNTGLHSSLSTLPAKRYYRHHRWLFTWSLLYDMKQLLTTQSAHVSQLIR